MLTIFPAAFGFQYRHHVPGADVYPFQTDIEHEIPFPRLQVDNAFGWIDLYPGGVDENVDGAEVFDDLGDGLGDLVVLGDVRRDGNGFDFLRGKASRSGFRLVEIEVEDRERSPVIGKPAGKRTSQRSTAAGDDHDFVSESEVAHFSYVQSSGFKVSV